ncbi:hypothetical protein GCM10018952_55040 [Streptosporangium vulgare]
MVPLPCARPYNWLGERTNAVPLLAADCIRWAVEQGWDPGQQGSAFALTVTVTENELAVLLSEPPQYSIPFLWGMIPKGGSIRDLSRRTEIGSAPVPIGG